MRAARGDAAIVNLQKSRWNTSDEVAFTVNLAVVPAPWMEWDQHRGLIKPGSKLREYHGLWRDRLNPSPGQSTDREFWVVRDETSAEVSGKDVAEQLQQIGLPRLNALLDRSELMKAIRAGDFGYIKISPQPPLAVMLSDCGTSQELEETIRELDKVPGWTGWHLKDDFVEWVRKRAHEHDQSR